MGRSQPVVRKRDIDGGWAWVVLVSSCLQQVFYGLNYATGLFNAMFLEEFGKSRQATSWIGSVQISLFCLSAPLSSLLMSRVGNTLTLVVGCLVGSSGFFFAYFAQSFLALFLTFGVMVGLGNGICYMPWVLMIATHFDKYRTLSYGLVSAFIGVGTMAFSPLVQYLEAQYGWRGCMLIFSGIYLHKIAVGLTFRTRNVSTVLVEDVTKNTKVDGNPDLRLISRHHMVAVSLMSVASIGSTRNIHRASDVISLDGSNSVVNSIQKSSSAETVGLPQLGHNESNKLPNGVQACDKDTSLLKIECVSTTGLNHSHHEISCAGMENQRPQRSVLTRVLLDAKLFTLAFSVFCLHGLSFLVFMHFPNFFEENGASPSDLATIMTTIGACSICCRLLVGLTSTSADISVLLVYTCSSFISGLAILLVPLLGKYFGGQMIFASCAGFYGNAYNCLMPVITLELCRLEDLSIAYSIQMLVCGLGALLAPPFGGWLYDISGGYELTFYTTGIVYILGALSMLLIPIISRDMKSDDQSTAET